MKLVPYVPNGQISCQLKFTRFKQSRCRNDTFLKNWICCCTRPFFDSVLLLDCKTEEREKAKYLAWYLYVLFIRFLLRPLFQPRGAKIAKSEMRFSTTWACDFHGQSNDTSKKLLEHGGLSSSCLDFRALEFRLAASAFYTNTGFLTDL